LKDAYDPADVIRANDAVRTTRPRSIRSRPDLPRVPAARRARSGSACPSVIRMT